MTVTCFGCGFILYEFTIGCNIGMRYLLIVIYNANPATFSLNCKAHASTYDARLYTKVALCSTSKDLISESNK